MQSAVITIAMIALAMVGLRNALKKLSNAKRERRERELALEVRLSETQRLRELATLQETAVEPAPVPIEGEEQTR